MHINLRRPTSRPSRDKRPAYQAAGGYRARLLMLIGLLLFVVMLMSEARKPENYHWLTKLQGKTPPPAAQKNTARSTPRPSITAPSGMKIVDITDSMPNRPGGASDRRELEKQNEKSEHPPRNQELSAGPLTGEPEKASTPGIENDYWKPLLSQLDSNERLTLFHLLRRPAPGPQASSPVDPTAAANLIAKLDQKITEVFSAQMASGFAGGTAADQATQSAALVDFKTGWDALLRPTLSTLAAGQTLDVDGTKKLDIARERIFQESLRLIQDATEVARPSDSLAWLLAWQQLLNSPLGATSSISPFELMTQPQQFRGRPVSFSGTVRGIESVAANREELGLSRYYVLWIQPKELDRTPYCVYAAELPVELQPKGEGFESLRQPITIRGIFWKVRTYVDTSKNVATCPLVLARNVILEETPTPVTPYRWEPPTWLLWSISLLLPLVAVAIAWRIYQTGREFVLPKSPGRTRLIQDSLNQLSSDESIESDLQRLARLESSQGDQE